MELMLMLSQYTTLWKTWWKCVSSKLKTSLNDMRMWSHREASHDQLRPKKTVTYFTAGVLVSLPEMKFCMAFEWARINETTSNKHVLAKKKRSKTLRKPIWTFHASLNNVTFLMIETLSFGANSTHRLLIILRTRN